jgi:hypothetical protein
MTRHYWGILSPYNDTFVSLSAWTRRGAIEQFCGEMKNWKYWYRKGFRAHKVHIVCVGAP